jgi:hypothetical protein
VRRQAYRLTAAGEAALSDWLTGPRVGEFAVRDEGLLRFFGDSLTVDGVLANLRREREGSRRSCDLSGSSRRRSRTVAGTRRATRRSRSGTGSS